MILIYKLLTRYTIKNDSEEIVLDIFPTEQISLRTNKNISEFVFEKSKIDRVERMAKLFLAAAKQARKELKNEKV